MMNLNHPMICIFMLSYFAVFFMISAKAAAPPKKTFDVVSYGAKADGKSDNRNAFEKAWKDACMYEGISTVWVPQGIFYLTPIDFTGPCHGNRSPKMEIMGTLKAPSSLTAYVDRTWITFESLSRLVISGNGTGLLDAQGQTSWMHSGCKSKSKPCKLNPFAIRLNGISHGAFTHINILNGMSFHLTIYQSHNVRIHDVNITAPGDSPNTDGIHIGDSANINVTSSRIGVGDDCVSIGPGSKNILVSNIFCGPGHGISLGSLGKYENEQEVKGVTVKNCTINSTMNGLRIKSWRKSKPSKASSIKFEDIIMINTSNPIIIDQYYCPPGNCESDPPSLVQLSDIEFRNVRGTSNTKAAVQLLCSSAVPCTDVTLIDIDLVNIHGDGPEVSICSNVTGVHSGIQRPRPCF